MPKAPKTKYKHLRPGEVPPVPTPEELDEKFMGMSFEELIKVMYALERKLEQGNAALAPFFVEYEHLRKRTFPNVSEESGTDTATVNITDDYRGRVQMQPDLYVSVLNPLTAREWLRDNGHGDLIKDTINAESLKAALKYRIKNAQGTPPDTIFKITPYKYAILVRA
jgi:hypothetical protein